MNQNYFEPNSSGFDQPPQYSINHQPPIIQEDLNQKLISDEFMTELRNELFTSIQYVVEMSRQREQTANLSTHTFEPLRRFNYICYDDDDDYDYEESIIPLNEIISQLPSSILITTSLPVLPIEDPEVSLIMRNEELNTIPKKDENQIFLFQFLNHFMNNNEELTETDIKRMDADDQAIQTILLGLSEDVYATVDSCEIAKEIWELVRHMMKENIASNLKFLNNLQPEWKRHVTIVRQTKNLHETDFTQIYDFLKINQEENSFNSPITHKDQSSSSTHPQQSFPINNKYNPQPSCNQNFMQPPMTSLKDINDPTEAMNAALILFAKAFQLSAPTNNNQRTSSNPRNRQLVQPVINMGQDRLTHNNGRIQGVQNAGLQSGGNQNGLVVVPGIANQSRSGNVVASRAEGDLYEIEEVNANCILTANLQQASTSGTQHDRAPVYDTHDSAEFLGTVCFGNDHIAAILGYGPFRRNTCFIRDLDGVDLLKDNRSTNLYTINLYDMASTKSWLWHQRLSHLNFDTINDLAKNDLVSGLPKFKYAKEHLCPSCEQGKSKRASHPPKPVPNSKQRLHLLHMDLCGPMRVARINGKQYVLVIVDDYSQYTWVHFLKTKDETPEQNGVVKRKNHTLVEAARTMLIFYHALLFLWAEAIATACYTQNHSIIHRRFNKTPYELIQGRKLDISYLHVFRAFCYLKNDREDISKLGAKGDIGFFIGYSANYVAYRVYNRRTKKIMDTLNVTFDELSAMAFEQNSSRPGLQSMTSKQISSKLKLTYAPSTIIPQRPSERDLDILFEPLHNEYLGGRLVEAPRAIPAAPVVHNLQAPTASMSLQDSTPVPTNSSNTSVSSHNADVTSQQHAQQQRNLTLLPTASAADNVSNARFEEELFVNPFGTPSTEFVVSSTQYVDPSNMHTFYQPILEPKIVKKALNDHVWIESMQEELHQFIRLDNRFSKGTIDLTLFTKRFDDDILVSKYVHESLKKYGLNTSYTVGTPMDIKDKLDLDQIGTPVDATKYRSMIGALMYLTSSRPDIIHATCVCARYQAHHTEKHLKE
nr:hypothetical protein [Tanacetum cinerariifolium]